MKRAPKRSVRHSVSIDTGPNGQEVLAALGALLAQVPSHARLGFDNWVSGDVTITATWTVEE